MIYLMITGAPFFQWGGRPLWKRAPRVHAGRFVFRGPPQCCTNAIRFSDCQHSAHVLHDSVRPICSGHTMLSAGACNGCSTLIVERVGVGALEKRMAKRCHPASCASDASAAAMGSCFTSQRALYP